VPGSTDAGCTTTAGSNLPATGGFFGQLEQAIDENGQATTLHYDGLGRIEKVIRPGESAANPTVRFGYTAYTGQNAPFWIKKEQRDGVDPNYYLETRTFYDGFGRVIQSQAEAASASQSIVASTQHNAAGQVLQQNAPYFYAAALGGYRTPDWGQPKTATSYDAYGRTKQVTNPDSSKTCTYYQGLQTAVVYEQTAGGVYKYFQKISTTDPLGRLSSVKDYTVALTPAAAACPAPQWNATTYGVTSYQYDVADRLVKTTGPDNAQITIGYDALGRKTQMSDPDMGTWTYAYDQVSNLTRQTDARGQTVCFYYDGLSRLRGKHTRTDLACPVWSDNPTLAVQYSYDAGANSIGRRTGMVDPSGSASWTYDSRGRVTSETKVVSGTGGGTFVTNWTAYDAMDRVRTMQYPDGESVTFSYTAQGPLKGVSGTSVYVGDTLYNALGQVSDRYLGSAAGVVRQKLTYTQAENFRLTALQSGVSPNFNNLQNITYSYDDQGNVLTVVDAAAAYGGSQTQTFTYDALNRLGSAQAAGGSNGTYTQRSYVYTSAGNISSFEGAALGANDAAHKHAVTHVAGAQRYWYDANGNATRRVNGSQDITLVYDAENHVTSITGSGVNATYVYDGDGKRVKATVGGTTTVYIGNYYERDNGTTVRKYYYAGAVRVAMRTGGNTFYLLNDHLTSTAITTNSSGARLTELLYFAYGCARYDAGGQMTLYRYTGQRIETGTGLYDYGARWYDPVIGRFLAADSIVPNPGDSQSLNRYMYVLGNPLKYSDPSGHAACAAGDRACWENEWTWKDRWYKEHGYENIDGRYIYTGNFVIENADALLRDDHVRRTKISNFARDLITNGTAAGEALARVAAYAAAFYKSFGAAINPFSVPRFVDDVSHVFIGMAGANILIDYATGANKRSPYFVQTGHFPDTDLKAIFQDGTANQPYHFWFYVAVSFWNGAAVAQAGNVFHEGVPPQTGRSFQDLALGAMGVDLGRQLQSGLPIYAVSDWIRSTLMR